MPRRPDGPLTGADIVPAGRPDAPELTWKAKAADELAQVFGSQHRQVAEATVEALLEALHHEADMTTQLLGSVGSGPGRLVGLEWRLKSPVSLARKIRDRAIEKRLTPAHAAKEQLGHIDYEIYRDVDKPFQVRLKAFNKSVELWRDVATPPGLRKLKVLGGVQIKSKKYSPPHGSEGDPK
jgi:hypothetical protein